jgi:hypothetical protein
MGEPVRRTPRNDPIEQVWIEFSEGKSLRTASGAATIVRMLYFMSIEILDQRFRSGREETYSVMDPSSYLISIV